ncbi:hypothetical protein [Aeromonas sp. A35_P]|uniref:hypothetical protein n=1 Tax=Aeromonas sp. A35_P TaxID=1983805 RepID=UPI000B9BA71F|nr:hypothetical protein [Aeromonas sp. A35_P]
MHRRLFMFALLLSLLIARVQASPAARITLLTDLVNAIGAAGEAVSKLTAGFKDLVVAGKDSYKYVAAARERDRLISLSRRTTNLIVSQNIRVVESLDQYLAERNPTQDSWARVIWNIEATLGSVQELLTDVQSEDGSFVLEAAFLTLNQTLSSRVSLLTQLATIPAPSSKEELALLRQASAKYKLLIENAREAVTQLNTYIKSAK